MSDQLLLELVATSSPAWRIGTPGELILGFVVLALEAILLVLGFIWIDGRTESSEEVSDVAE